MTQKNFLQITEKNFVWHVDADKIAKNRAEYYASKEGQEVYQEEYDFTYNDAYELQDWFMGNMDWSDVSDSATLIKSPSVSEPDLNDAEFELIQKSKGD